MTPTITQTAGRPATDAPAAPRANALLWVVERPELWLETMLSLCAMSGIATVFVCVHHSADDVGKVFKHDKIKVIETFSLPDAAAVAAAGTGQLLVVLEPIAVAPEAFERAIDWIDEDPRIGTVSFLSNAAGYLSFPHRNSEVPVPPPGHNEQTLTERLRTRLPDTGPVPISNPEGAAVLINCGALSTSDGLQPWPDADPFFCLVEFGLRASRRGFNNYLDAGTFVWRMTAPGSTSGLTHDAPRHRLHLKHPFFPGLHDYQRDTMATPLASALDLARAKAQGLRVLIDGSALGPQEMGTQLLIVALTSQLAEHPDIKSVALCVPDPANIPAYAQHLRLMPKITFHRAGGLHFPDAPEVDIIHRPYQPIEPIPWDRWRALGKRSIITIQDLIAYRNGSYFQNWENWAGYRLNLEAAVARADAVFSISHDVLGPIREEKLGIADDALFVVENGIDHRSENEPSSIPSTFLSRGWQAEPFLVILGANYSHKNRDLGIRVWQKLRERGRKEKLVLVGANVPQGSTRLEEVKLLQGNHEDLLVLPDVPGEERNWMLRHASLFLYPTAAEGFGQIPFEAGSFGCPSLYVSFGPLRELTDDPDAPRQYDLDALTDRAELLLTDPDAARKAVAGALRNIGDYTWKRTAEKSVEAYFSILGRPRGM